MIQMDSYYPLDITHMVKTLCSQYPLPETSVPGFHFPKSCRIMTKAASAAPRSPRRDSDRPDRLKTKVHGKDGFSIGRQEVDLRYIEQIVDTEQTASLSMLLKYAVEHLIDGKRTLPEIAEYLIRELDQKGLVFFSGGSYIPCGYAMPRAQEIYSCLNRYRRP